MNTHTRPRPLLEQRRQTGHLRAQLGCLLCCIGGTAVMAESSPSNTVVALLSVPKAPVTAMALREPSAAWAESNLRIVAPQRAKTDGELWADFEAQYRPQQPHAVSVLRLIENGKYWLDSATYSFDQLARNIDDNTFFTFDRGSLRHIAPGRRAARESLTTSWTDGLQHVRIKLDVKLRSGQPYVGVRIIIPFGN